MHLPSHQTVLFFSPHCDDEVIAAGALLSKLSENNQVIVYYVANSPGGVNRHISDDEKVRIRQDEARKACAVLGCQLEFLNWDTLLKTESENKNLLARMQTIVSEIKPSVVLSVYEKDAHTTHRKVTELVRQALGSSGIPLWLGEVWTPIEKPDDAFYFDDTLMDKKFQALAAYESQLERTDWVEAIKHLNRYRAITLKEILGGFGSAPKPQGSWAEAFRIIT